MDENGFCRLKKPYQERLATSTEVLPQEQQSKEQVYVQTVANQTDTFGGANEVLPTPCSSVLNAPVTSNSFVVLSHVPNDITTDLAASNLINIALGADPIGGND